MVSAAVPHEIPLQQQDSSRGLGCDDSRVQPAHHAAIAIAGDGCALHSVRRGEDSGNIRVHVEHTAVDNTAAQLRGVLPCAAHHSTHCNRGDRLPLGSFCLL